MSEKALPARSIYGWDPTTSTWLKILVDANGKVQITSTDLTTILSEIQSETYGLEAIKEAIDEIEAGSGATPQQIWEYVSRTLTSVPSGSALEATLTAIKGGSWSNETLKAIKDAIDAIETVLPSDPADESGVEAAITAAHLTTDGKVDDVEAKLDHATYGLSALKTLIDDIEGKVDDVEGKTGNLPSDPADESLVEAAITSAHSATETKIERKITHMDFWADNTPQVVLTQTATDDFNLSNLVIAGIPTGATLVRVVVLLKIASIRDTSGSDNAINGVTALKVDADSGYASTVTAIDIPDNSWAVDVSQALERGGDVMIGDNDVKTEITGNGTFYARLENICADGLNLKLEDVAWGVRIYFY